MAQDRRDFLGKGFKFPFNFSGRTGGITKNLGVGSSGMERHIEESIHQIIYTLIGSRVIRRDFGSTLRGIVFSPNDSHTDVLIDYIIRSGIETWEPRVLVGPITVDRTMWQDGQLELGIEFKIIKTNSVRNMVFPYFLTEDQRSSYETPGAP